MKQRNTNTESEKVAALIDDELIGIEREEIEKRLEQETGLREEFEVQKKVKGLVKDCTLMEKAPIHLRARIRRSIENAQKTPGFLQLLADIFRFHASKSLVATAVLLALITFPWLQNMQKNESAGGEEMKYEIVQGKVICIECEALHNMQIKSGKHSELHHTGLKTANGTVWTFLDYGKGSKLLHDFSRLNSTLKVEGESLRGGHTINVADFQKI